ncbi:MAG: DUF1836 domain-containing protein [Thermoanaerobacteraceae bacterium]|jgi:DNA-binding transcriptional MerR regulator|nr:DUF1836 domain-containing protein [Thermoanaerobacteraceae bacterium]
MNPPSYYPGTVVPVSTVGLFTGIFSITNGITLSQVCEITGLEPGTVQNWIKRGYVTHPVDRKYSKEQLARIVLINFLRETFTIEKVANLLSYVNGNLLDDSDNIMNDSEIYQCLCDILLSEDINEELNNRALSARIDELLADFTEPYPGAKDRLKLVIEAMTYAWWSAEHKRVANQLTENI